MYIFIILLQDITMIKLCQKSIEELLDKSYVELYFVIRAMNKLIRFDIVCSSFVGGSYPTLPSRLDKIFFVNNSLRKKKGNFSRRKKLFEIVSGIVS